VGCDGVIVSNHGGRQLDGELASFDALPAVARAIGGRSAVLLDGGIRRGSDIVKALASGAQAVMIGRATFYGVAAAGEPGARRALEILKEEFVRTMQLCGLRRIGDIGPDLLVK
jgi:(S)-mandelate dehydrogenase